MKALDLTNQVFGRLTVISRAGTQNKIATWNCVCSCNNKTVARSNSLKSGHTTSCGCYRDERQKEAGKFITVHGMKHTNLYTTWESMKKRTSNPNCKDYSNYGGRGIKVCDRWLKFENFYADMGDKPHEWYSLDRYPDVNGNYEPSNCRWATSEQQNNNRRPKTKTILMK